MSWDDYWDAKKAFETTGIQSAKHEARRGLGPWWTHELRGPLREPRRLTWGTWVSGKRLPSALSLVAHVVGQLVPRGVVGLRSAAAMHGLLEAPDAVDLVVPRGAWKTTATWPFAHHRFTVSRMAEGDHVLSVPVEPHLSLPITSRLRTVVDLLRFRAVVAPRLAASALRRFLDAGGDQALLHELARAQRATTALVRLEALARALPPPPPVSDCRPLVFPAGIAERVPPVAP